MKRYILILTIFIISAVTSQHSLSPSEKTGVFLLVDNEAPIILIHSPQPIAYNNASPLLVNFTVIEPSLDSIWYSLNSENNISISSQFYLSLPEGDYNLKIYANDSRNRQNYSEVNFIINNSVPIQPPSPPGGGSSGGSSGGADIGNIRPIEEESKTPLDDIIKPEIRNPDEQKININFQTNLLFLIFLIFLIIIIILIIYRFIKKNNKKQKWKRKR
mgnify:CR=1 FL=1